MQDDWDGQRNKETGQQYVIQVPLESTDELEIGQSQTDWCLRIIEDPYPKENERPLTQNHRNLAEPDLLQYLSNALEKHLSDLQVGSEVKRNEVPCYANWLRWFYVLKAYFGFRLSLPIEPVSVSSPPPPSPSPASSFVQSPPLSPRLSCQICTWTKLNVSRDYLEEEGYPGHHRDRQARSPCSDLASTHATEAISFEGGPASFTAQSSPSISATPTPVNTPRKIRL